MHDNIKGGALTETTFLTLLAVFEPRHGYAIMQFVSAQTGGRVQIGAGTLYGAINTMEKKKWIAMCGNGDNSRTKEYLVTDIGRQVALDEAARMAGIMKLSKSIMKGGEGK